MEQRKKDIAELHEIQHDFADYIYKNYRVFIEDEDKINEVTAQYNGGEGVLTTMEYLEATRAARIYIDIEKIEFTKFTVGPTRTLEMHYRLNDVYESFQYLDTLSAETGKFKYKSSQVSGNGPYFIERRSEPLEEDVPEDLIAYNDSGKLEKW